MEINNIGSTLKDTNWTHVKIKVSPIIQCYLNGHIGIKRLFLKRPNVVSHTTSLRKQIPFGQKKVKKTYL